jgi:hypothetical protein
MAMTITAKSIGAQMVDVASAGGHERDRLARDLQAVLGAVQCDVQAVSTIFELHRDPSPKNGSHLLREECDARMRAAGRRMRSAAGQIGWGVLVVASDWLLAPGESSALPTYKPSSPLYPPSSFSPSFSSISRFHRKKLMKQFQTGPTIRNRRETSFGPACTNSSHHNDPRASSHHHHRPSTNTMDSRDSQAVAMSSNRPRIVPDAPQSRSQVEEGRTNDAIDPSTVNHHLPRRAFAIVAGNSPCSDRSAPTKSKAGFKPKCRFGRHRCRSGCGVVVREASARDLPRTKAPVHPAERSKRKNHFQRTCEDPATFWSIEPNHDIEVLSSLRSPRAPGAQAIVVGDSSERTGAALGSAFQLPEAPTPPLEARDSTTPLTPPRTPLIPRLMTPDLAPMALDAEFCPCCGNEEDCINANWYLAGRSKMDAQR